VAGPRLVLIDPPSSGAAGADDSVPPTTSGKKSKRTSRRGSTPLAPGETALEAYLAETGEDPRNGLDWATGVRAFAALAVGCTSGALFAVYRRRPLYSF
jgi:hypothetical protein